MSQEVWFNKKTQKNVQYLGRKNKLIPENETFVKICKMPQKQLKNVLAMYMYEVGYKDVHVGDGFIYAKGSIPFCLTAHMDTVHAEVVKTTYEYNKNGDYLLSSPQGIGGDDRCGIYMIIKLLEKGYKPYVVFCEDEEIGCVGSRQFIKTSYIDEIGKECKYIIELDRANNNDAVFYDCDNKDFEKFITENTKYKTASGSCSDISYLCPAAKIAGVNLSCGYYNAHTLGEYVNMTEMQRTQDTVEKLLNTECIQYEYIEREYVPYYYGRVYGKYNGWYDDDDDYYGTGYYGKTVAASASTKGATDYLLLEVQYIDKDNEDVIAYGEGQTESECWEDFFKSNPQICFNDVLDWDFT